MNIFFWIIFSIYIFIKLFECWMEFLNYKHLQKYGTEIPEFFKDILDVEKLEKIKYYTIEKIQFGILSTAYSAVIMLIFIFGGIINYFNSMILNTCLPFYVSGILFFVIIFIIYSILQIPFDLYSTFKIEKKYDFNTMTGKLWFFDFIKTIIVSGVIISVLLFAILFTISNFKDTWWLWSWIVFFVFTIFIMYISPYVLEPLFNKFVPVENEELINSLKDIMGRIGIKVTKVLKMDASKRTKHTNAYFSGIGHVKRIVLFDTLIEQMNDNEIISVIAHEAGHWKKKHIIKSVILFEIISFIFFFIAYRLMGTEILLNTFYISIHPEINLLYYSFIKFFLIYFLFGIVMFPIAPLMHCLTRKHEKEADRFAVDLVKNSSDLKSALIKLSADNLSNLFPHPLYEAFHYSHPSILKRLNYISEMGAEYNKPANDTH